MSELGQTIKRLREARGLSLSKLAGAAGMSKAHLWDLEHGNSDNPSVDLLTQLGAALDVPPADLFQSAITQGE